MFTRIQFLTIFLTIFGTPLANSRPQFLNCVSHLVPSLTRQDPNLTKYLEETGYLPTLKESDGGRRFLNNAYVPFLKGREGLKPGVSLTAIENYYLALYKGDDYYIINHALRNPTLTTVGFTSASTLRLQAEEVTKVLNQKFLSYEGVTFRYVRIEDEAEVSRWLDEGKIVKDKGFKSSSTDYRWALVKNNPATALSKFELGFVINGKTGKKLFPKGDAAEREVLFSPNTPFRIEKVIANPNGSHTVFLTEVENDSLMLNR